LRRKALIAHGMKLGNIFGELGSRSNFLNWLLLLKRNEETSHCTAFKSKPDLSRRNLFRIQLPLRQELGGITFRQLQRAVFRLAFISSRRGLPNTRRCLCCMLYISFDSNPFCPRSLKTYVVTASQQGRPGSSPIFAKHDIAPRLENFGRSASALRRSPGAVAEAASCGSSGAVSGKPTRRTT